MSDFALVAAWRQHLEGRDLSPSTIRCYTSAIHRLGTEVVKGPIVSATEDHIDAFMASLDRRARRSLAARGCRSFFGWAVRRGFVDEDPTLELRKIKPPESKPPVVLEEDELGRFIHAAMDVSTKRGYALSLMYSIGARRSELCGIAPRDIIGDRVRLRLTKGGRERHVQLNALAHWSLEQLRPWWTEDSICDGLRPQTVTEWAHAAAVEAGLQHKVERRSSHILRASFATHLLRAGVPIHVVKELLGHQSIETTQIYAVATDPERAAAVDLLPFGIEGVA